MPDATLLILGVIIAVLLVILGIVIFLKRLKVKAGITSMTSPAITVQEDHFFREGSVERVGVNYFSVKGKNWLIEVHDPIGQQFKIGQPVRVLFSGMSILPEAKIDVSNIDTGIDLERELEETEKAIVTTPPEKKPKRPRPKKKVKRK